VWNAPGEPRTCSALICCVAEWCPLFPMPVGATVMLRWPSVLGFAATTSTRHQHAARAEPALSAKHHRTRKRRAINPLRRSEAFKLTKRVVQCTPECETSQRSDHAGAESSYLSNIRGVIERIHDFIEVLHVRLRILAKIQELCRNCIARHRTRISSFQRQATSPHKNHV
jgi:hypothetical protein